MRSIVSRVLNWDENMCLYAQRTLTNQQYKKQWVERMEPLTRDGDLQDTKISAYLGEHRPNRRCEESGRRVADRRS